MQIEELETTCCQAAADLVERGRPVPASVVLPQPDATRIVSLADFPDTDGPRLHLLSDFADDQMRPANAPCWGFVAEAVTTADGDSTDVVVVVYGARGRHPRITAAALEPDGLGPFGPAEELDPSAMPFLAPLQHAAEAATPPDVMGR